MNSLSFIVSVEERVKQIRDMNILNKKIVVVTKHANVEGRLIEIAETIIVILPQIGFGFSVKIEDILLITWE